ncbi:Signal peptidase I [Blastochloris viridis]|uniref:Signal peptidase I n=1 Tax=Blastochloris viridis TaxID=1079 RepID=A0A0S4Q4A0_BLAVI|nr:Signal peptidase I [Blastochloris viridis]
MLRSFALASYHVPTESMVPTIEIGDRIAVNKAAYGYSRFSLPGGALLPRLPLPDGRLFGSLPSRGDVVVFRHPTTDVDLLKRVVALPGDRVRIEHGLLIVNDTPAARAPEGPFFYRAPEGWVVRVAQYREQLPAGRSHPILKRTDSGPGNDMAEMTVPAGHFFAMGDNRDNSEDSRFAEVGTVPFENLIGRVEAVMYSISACEPEPGLRCPPPRWLQSVE